MFKLFKEKQNKSLASPVDGVIVDICDVQDPLFSSKTMGDGYAVEYLGTEVVSPIEGEVVMVFPTGHAFGVKQGDLEVLVHIGTDTVELQGDGFHTMVEVGEQVVVGSVLSKVDPAYLNEKGYDSTVMVVITSGQTFVSTNACQVEKGAIVGEYK